MSKLVPSIPHSDNNDKKDLIIPAFQFVLNMVLDAIPEQVKQQSKETQTEPTTSLCNNPGGEPPTPEAVTIREQLAKHFISSHNCQPGKRCNIIPRLKQFGSDKNHAKSNNRRCDKGSRPNTTYSMSQYCPLCYTIINNGIANHIDQCIRNNTHNTILCIFCSLQINTGEVQSHLCSHASMVPRLRGKQSLPNQSNCNDIAERIMILIATSIPRGQLGSIMNEWLHAIFCIDQCSSCNTISLAFSQLTQHTFNSAILTDHYCSCMPLYHYILRSHVIACNKINCPLEDCKY